MHGCWETLEGQPERGIRVRLTRVSPDAAMLTTLSDLAATRRWVQKWQPFGASHPEARAMLANGGSRQRRRKTRRRTAFRIADRVAAVLCGRCGPSFNYRRVPCCEASYDRTTSAVIKSSASTASSSNS